MYDIFDEGYRLGAKAMYLSGSGPTIIAMVESGRGDYIKNMTAFFKKAGMNYSFKDLTIDNVGTVLKYKKEYTF